jgi:hypothetical protein
LPFSLLGFFLPNFRENLFDGNTTLGSFRLRSFAFGLLALPNPIGDTPISELLSLDTKARVVSLRLGYRRAMKNSKHKQRKAKSSPDQICYPLAQNSPLALDIPQHLPTQRNSRVVSSPVHFGFRRLKRIRELG